MNRLTNEDRCRVLACLVEGNSIRSTVRITGIAKRTVSRLVGERKERISGSPFPELISTSHAERNNLTIRMQSRRFTRLTNAFSKSVVNHRLALAIHFVHYNFARIHSSLRVTPAMAAGVSDRVWELADIVSLLEKEELALAA